MSNPASQRAKVHELAVNAVCPINRDPTTVFEHNMVKTLEEFGMQVVAALSGGPPSSDAEEAAYWRDLTLLHPMDVAMIFSGAPDNLILLNSLKNFIERKRASKRSATPENPAVSIAHINDCDCNTSPHKRNCAIYK